MPDAPEKDVLDTKVLDKLIKAMSHQSSVKIGILGSSARSGESGVTNAQVGAAHEYGTENLPKRSFLRAPIAEHMETKLYNGGKFDLAQLKQVVREGKITAWMNRIAIIAEEVVQGAFDTGGYGQWKPSDMTDKKNHQTLVETQQLRKSITSEVVDG